MVGTPSWIRPLDQLRSSRRLEAECRRNVELMWLLGRLYPDHKSIAEFRRMHRDAVTGAGAELVRFARSCGLIRGEWIAIDGTKFRAVASAGSVRERQALERYLDSCEQADEETQAVIDPSAVQAALDKLKQHPEPEARPMRMAGGFAPAYNVQTAVDAEHALIVAHAVTLEATDNRSLEPMAQAAQKALEADTLNIVTSNSQFRNRLNAPPIAGPRIGTQDYFQSEPVLPAIGSSACAARGPKSRAGLWSAMHPEDNLPLGDLVNFETWAGQSTQAASDADRLQALEQRHDLHNGITLEIEARAYFHAFTRICRTGCVQPIKMRCKESSTMRNPQPDAL